MKTRRLCIYPKDIALILDITPRHARRYLHMIRAALGKKPHQFISISEFADYTGLDEEEIRRRCI